MQKLKHILVLLIFASSLLVQPVLSVLDQMETIDWVEASDAEEEVEQKTEIEKFVEHEVCANKFKVCCIIIEHQEPNMHISSLAHDIEIPPPELV